jgi:hypothetical protein
MLTGICIQRPCVELSKCHFTAGPVLKQFTLILGNSEPRGYLNICFQPAKEESTWMAVNETSSVCIF